MVTRNFGHPHGAKAVKEMQKKFTLSSNRDGGEEMRPCGDMLRILSTQ